ncbi:MAG: hypothetical protein O7J95_21620 [Planctomycetota bacterium]|nr:hypothetical protein [Planctomycetota bacterium]
MPETKSPSLLVSRQIVLLGDLGSASGRPRGAAVSKRAATRRPSSAQSSSVTAR